MLDLVLRILKRFQSTASRARAPQEPNEAGRLYKEVLEAFKSEHDFLMATFRDIDRKAQGTAAVAGIFLAAIFAFVREVDSGSHGSLKLLISLAMAFLVTAVLTALFAIRVRKVVRVPPGKSVKRLASDLLNLTDPEELTHRLSGFYVDQCTLWGSAVRSTREANRDKGRFLLVAQIALVAAVICVSAVSVTVIWNIK